MGFNAPNSKVRSLSMRQRRFVPQVDVLLCRIAPSGTGTDVPSDPPPADTSTSDPYPTDPGTTDGTTDDGGDPSQVLAEPAPYPPPVS
jgi:hypothetical protein